MKTLHLQKLLSWAFVEELVKGGGEDGLNSPLSAWGAFDAIAQLGVRIDRDRGINDLPMQLEQGEPHADAVLVAQAVRSVAGITYKIAPLDELLSDWPEAERWLANPFYEEVVKRLQNRTQKQIAQSVIAQIVTHAVLCKTPCFSAPVPKVDFVKQNGKPLWFMKQLVLNELGREVEMEMDGYNKKSGRPFTSAYRKYVLCDNPQGDIMARIEYQFWVTALNHIFLTLNGNMQDHRLSLFSVKSTPWLQKKFLNKNSMIDAISA